MSLLDHKSDAGVTHPPTSTMIELLIPLWQRVLQLSSVRIDDNFFDLGGDSSLALELFNQVANVCGRELPPVMIYHAPTIASLAAVLEGSSESRFPPVVLLKPGTEQPPVFITHGLGGSVIDFYQVLKHIQLPHPIYGMQAKGIDGVEQPFERIEDMAQFYLAAIRELQPHGPHVLIGFSLGGLVTLEMAQRLTDRGEKVALLAMLDSYPHIRYLSLRQRLRLRMRLAARRLAAVTDSHKPPNGTSLSPAMQRVRDSAHLALTRYRPKFYHGKIRFVRAEVATEFPDDPVAVWGKFTDELEVETVPGDHLGIMTTHFDSLALVISRFVKESL
jgi:acetoacetyl-CoA synthetase